MQNNGKLSSDDDCKKENLLNHMKFIYNEHYHYLGFKCFRCKIKKKSTYDYFCIHKIIINSKLFINSINEGNILILDWLEVQPQSSHFNIDELFGVDD